MTGNTRPSRPVTPARPMPPRAEPPHGPLSPQTADGLTRRTVLYLRVSTEDQARDGNSLTDQEKAGRLYVASRVAMGEPGWTEIAADEDDIYCDPGVSGATRDRPALNRLLANAHRGLIGRIVVTKLDRMSRRAADLLAIEDELDQCSVERVYIKDAIDTSTPVGRLLRTVLAAVAELERDIILERTRAGKIEDVKNGAVWLTGRTIGYRYIPADKANGRRAGVEIDEETAPLVRRIFTEVANGTSLHALAARLNAEGVPTMRGASFWRAATLRKIIYNPLFTGRAAYGKVRNAKSATGKTTTRPAQPVAYADVPAIVSVELARVAQAMLARNRITATRNAKRNYLLGGGLMRCGAVLDDGSICGSTMHGDAHHSGYQYRCHHVMPSGQRGRHSLPGARAEEAVREALRALLLNPESILTEIEALAHDGAARAAATRADLDRIARALREVETRQSRLLDLYLVGHLDQTAYRTKADELATTQATLVAEQAEALARRDAATAHDVPVDDARALCAHLAVRLDALTPAQWRHVVHTLCMRIVGTRELLMIEGAFDDAVLGHEAEEEEYGGGIVTTTSARDNRRAESL